MGVIFEIGSHEKSVQATSRECISAEWVSVLFGQTHPAKFPIIKLRQIPPFTGVSSRAPDSLHFNFKAELVYSSQFTGFSCPKMPKLAPPLSISDPDPALLRKLDPFKRVCVTTAGIVAGATLFAWLFPALGGILPGGWRLMTAQTALGLLFSALSLEFSESRYSIRSNRLGQVLALVAALLGTAILAEYAFHIAAGLERFFPFDPNSRSPWPGRPSPQTAAGLALLGITLALIRVRARIAVRIADLVAMCLGLLVLALVSGEIFGALRIFGLSPITRTSPQTLVCLALLTFVAFLRRSEVGVFSIFLGRGIGSRIARGLGPVLLVLPFLREIARQRMIHSQMLPEHYATAILASAAAAMSFLFLIVIVWHIKTMEAEIHGLSLRDELTGLYNLRGFTLLGEQVLSLAQRSQLTCSVLFVDLDNLKEINDTWGHNAGSAVLVEMAEVLKQATRETDVVGRIGGDEFAVVCQCSHVAISIAAERLEVAVAALNSEAGREFPLSLSVGYATAHEHQKQSLKELLTLADKAMYDEKRRKKVSRA
jgi:diguanylate cyclase (GGDEF)-like protein